jgi:hypothetical protein
VLFALQEVVGVGFRRPPGVDTGFCIGAFVSAVIVSSIGGIGLVRFMREYPLLPIEAGVGGGYGWR